MKSKMLLVRVFIFFITFFFGASFANNIATQNTYKILTPQEVPKDFVAPKGKILVLEFFSPGCPHCARLEPFIEQWQEKNKSLIVRDNANKNDSNTHYIIFKQAPATFEKDWDYYAKAWYIAKKLGLSGKLDPEIIAVAQNNFAGLHSDQQVRSFFLSRGVAATAFDQVMKDATIQQDMQNDQKLMRDFKILGIPTVIVANGKNVYMISNATVPHGDPQVFIDTLTSLTAKKLKSN